MKKIESMLRVDHAGEHAAVHLYRGQIRVLGQSRMAPELHAMWEQESTHYASFDQELQKRQIAPTLFQPLWEKTAYALGVATALLGPKAAMACTEAVEEVITDHYKSQLDALGATDPASPLIPVIHKAYTDEQAHHMASQTHQKPDEFKRLKSAIRLGCRVAIRLSERI